MILIWVERSFNLEADCRGIYKATTNITNPRIPADSAYNRPVLFLNNGFRLPNQSVLLQTSDRGSLVDDPFTLANERG